MSATSDEGADIVLDAAALVMLETLKSDIEWSRKKTASLIGRQSAIEGNIGRRRAETTPEERIRSLRLRASRAYGRQIRGDVRLSDQERAFLMVLVESRKNFRRREEAGRKKYGLAPISVLADGFTLSPRIGRSLWLQYKPRDKFKKCRFQDDPKHDCDLGPCVSCEYGYRTISGLVATLSNEERPGGHYLRWSQGRVANRLGRQRLWLLGLDELERLEEAKG